MYLFTPRKGCNPKYLHNIYHPYSCNYNLIINYLFQRVAMLLVTARLLVCMQVYGETAELYIFRNYRRGRKQLENKLPSEHGPQRQPEPVTLYWGNTSVRTSPRWS